MPFGGQLAGLWIYPYFSCQERNRNHWQAGLLFLASNLGAVFESRAFSVLASAAVPRIK